MADYLDELEGKSIYIVREGFSRFRDVALLWSIGKDSTALLWIARKAFFGKLPFPVVHIDTSYKFPEIYAFRDRYAKEWGLKLLVARNDAALAAGMNNRRGVLNCCGALKTDGLKLALRDFGLKALFLAIRRDEHGVRAKERYFSRRDEHFNWNYKDQATELWDIFGSKMEAREHFRIHPMLHWTELDIWRYIEREKIPMVPLYFARGGKRYRSIGCAPCCTPVDSNAASVRAIIRELERTKVSERAGRAQDKEDAFTMQKLRSLGYM
jgi:sulfate adenylyltransferase subunit 2